MPDDSHVFRIVSMFNMFSEPRYNTGLRLRSLATLDILAMGDSFCLPVANQ